MNKNHSETGRSLLEIVCTLAIIGILMIVGSFGYGFISLKYREKKSVQQISELATRYKLAPVQPKEGKKRIALKTVYPEGTLTESNEAMVIPDTPSSRVYLQSNVETSSFSIVVNQTLKGTCEELLENGEYDMVVFKEGVSIEDALDTQSETEKNAFSRAYLATPEGEELIKKICAEETETKKVTGLGIIFDHRCPGTGSSFWYRGRCWNCPSSQIQDIHGACCSALNECGVCSCPNGACNTKTKQCVECIEDANCANNAKGKKCDTSTNTCVACLTDTDCQEGSFCTSKHTCVQCDTLDEKKHLIWNSKKDECECAKPLLSFSKACSEETDCCEMGTKCHEGVCSECWEHKGDTPKIGACNNADFPVCKASNAGGNKCERCPKNPTAVGDECYEVCGGCSSSSNLTCDTAQNKCVCEGELHWNGSQCVECTESSHCSIGKTCDGTGSCKDCTVNSVCDSCQALDPTKPYWNGTRCIECFANGENGGCIDESKPACNTETNTCGPCPTSTPIWHGTQCVECTKSSHCPTGKICGSANSCVDCTVNSLCASCQILDATKPYWDGAQCVECLSNGSEGGCVDEAKPVCNVATKTCVPCPAETPNWNGTQCVECTENSHCPAGKTCNQTNSCEDCTVNSLCGSCQALDPTKPYWDGTQCVECLSNGSEGGCVDVTKPICHITTKTCIPCPAETPNWNGTQCVECTQNSHCPAGKTCNQTGGCDDCTPNSLCASCQELDPAKPYWTGTQCIGCFSNGPAGGCTDEAKPVCNKETKICEACPAETPNWNGLRCLECFSHTHCANRTDGRISCDIDSHMCMDCPENSSGVPTDQRIGLTACYCNPGYVVNGIGTKCVESCTSDFDCAGREDGNTTCDTETNRCVSCPEGYFWENGQCKTCGTDRNCVCKRYGLSPWTAGASCGKGKSLYVTFQGYLVLDKDVTEIGKGQGCRTGTLTLTSEETGETYTVPMKGYTDAYTPFRLNLKKGVYKAVIQTNHAKGTEFCYPSYDTTLGYAAMCAGTYYKPCPKGTFLDTGSNKCVNCLSNYGTGVEGACTNYAKPWCDTASHSCEACPANKPYWNAVRHECMECISGNDCSGEKSWCDTSSGTCVKPSCKLLGKEDGLQLVAVWGDKCNRTATSYPADPNSTMSFGTTYVDRKTCSYPLNGYLYYFSDKSFSNTNVAEHTYSTGGTANLAGLDMFKEQNYTFRAGNFYSIAVTAVPGSTFNIDFSKVKPDLMCH